MAYITAKEQIILDLLEDGVEMCGLDMVKADSRVKRGTVYVTLYTLAEKELVTYRKNGVRYFYKLAKSGTKAPNTAVAATILIPQGT